MPSTRSDRSDSTPLAPRLKPADAERRRRALEAAGHLSRTDARLAAMIQRIGPHRPRVHPDPFRTLVGSIVQQQVSMAAGAAIQKRLADLCPRRRITPDALLSLTPARLRRAGLSRQKARYMHDLAAHFADGRLSTRTLRRLDDEAVVAAATQVLGVGRWTAEMLLMFCLERPDVWPIDDLGLRKAVKSFLDLSEMPAADVMRGVGEPWRPYRSYASWYLWRSLEGPIMPGVELAK